MELPRVIFFDAVGTLFGVRGSVGEIYRAIAARMGVEVSAQKLDRAFFESFKAAPPLAFSQAEISQIPPLEYEWWRAISRETFTKAGALEQFSDFNVFFGELYDYFARAEPWSVYADVFPALNYWRERGVELGIISNFDSRIYSVLEVLKLREFFGSITISSLTGSAKPEREIFLNALKKHDCLPHQAWHIGDSLKEDYRGAEIIGIQPFLIKR